MPERRLELGKARHELQEQELENAHRRRVQTIVLHAVVGILIMALLHGGVAIALAECDDTRDNAWSLIASIVGALGGAIAGYVTGKRSK